MNIKEIAQKAGVSIATVSHVVNKTRYVSDELTERVLRVIHESDGKPGFLLRNRKALQSDVVLCVTANVSDYFYVDIIRGIQMRAKQQGNRTVVIHSDSMGLLNEYIRLEKPKGVIIVADKTVRTDLSNVKDLPLPAVWIDHVNRTGKSHNPHQVLIDEFENACKGVRHLIKNGHESVGFVYVRNEGVVPEQQLAGYKHALKKNGMLCDPSLVVELTADEAVNVEELDSMFASENAPTAVLAADSEAAVEILKYVGSHNMKCPEDISIVCLQEFALSHMLTPPVTTVAHDPVQIGMNAFDRLLGQIKEMPDESEALVAASRIKVRESSQSIARGPLGERAASPDVLHLSEEEIERIRSQSYTAAISFHYSGTAWARLHEKGIKDVFAELGVKVLAVTDAHFDPNLQNRQLASIQTMSPDVLISIPADEVETASSYRSIVESGTRLVLINNVPDGFSPDDYVTCVSVNERENGRIAGRVLGEYLIRHGKKKIGFLMHGASFFATEQRDMAARQVISEEFPELEIITTESFLNEANAFDTCYEMIQNHPEIEGLYVSWEGPALAALRVLKELNREDISVVTADLDIDVALNIATGGPIKGLSAQRPYEQGRAMAMSAANALIDKRIPTFIGVSPYKVTSDNLLAAWQDVLRDRAPASLVSAFKESKSRQQKLGNDKLAKGGE